MSTLNIDQIWKNTQEELKVVMASAVFQTFVLKTQLVTLNNNIATIACPNAYLVEMNKRRYYQLFKDAIDNQTKENNTVEFLVQEAPKPIELSSLEAPLLSYQSPAATHNLHPQYTFQNLVVGNSNNFAYAAAQGIVKNPGTSYNPFFIWGGVGVGKTHIMQAVGHELLKTNPHFKIRYFPAETFGNELVQALKTKSINQFKNKYRQLDCILVDDIQFIAGKEYTQEEFFHTFNALHMNGKQVILTSDRKPSEIKGLEDRLVSRFLGGLTVDIQPLDFEMRLAIINEKAKTNHINISMEAISYLADQADSNIREIEGRLRQIYLKAQSLNVEEITLDFVQNESTLRPDSLNTSNKDVSPRHLISVCAKYFNIKTGDLIGASRKKDLVSARHITAYLLLNEIKLPLEDVGHHLGGRDHTSIMHARDKITNDLINNNPQIRKIVSDIRSQLI
jgi:chromosomal replication initiator protein